MANDRVRKNVGTGRNSQNVRSTKSRSRSWFCLVFILFFTWFLTGFPFSVYAPQTITVKAEVENGAYGLLSESWSENILPILNDEVLEWGISQGYGEATLRGAIKAASLERDPNTGEPSPGTGYRVSVFDLLSLPGTESDISTATVDPYSSNPTGQCLAWQEILKRVDLGPAWILGQQTALRKIAKSLNLDPYKIYGSCGAGALGFNQAMPDNWWNYMGAGFDPWDRELAAEFTARYFTRAGYFTHGRRVAIHAYNPGASEASYVEPIVNRADKLAESYTSLGLADLEVSLLVTAEGQDQVVTTEESLIVEMSTSGESYNELTIWPVNCPPGSYGFGAYNPFQAFSPIGHTGVDKMCPTGTPVKAAGAGIVEYAGYWPSEAYWRTTGMGYGNTVWILHGYFQGEPLFTVYAHNSEILVEQGQVVQAGDIIAMSGESGAGTGPHVHFEVRLGGGTENKGTDSLGRVWDEYSPQDPAIWIGTGKQFVSDDLPLATNSALSLMGGTDQEVMLELKSTPVLRLAMKIGEIRESLREVFIAGQELSAVSIEADSFVDDLLSNLDEVNELLSPIGISFDASSLEVFQKAEKSVSRMQKGLEVLDQFDRILTSWHFSLSRLAIAGQDRDLNLDPLINWLLYPSENSGGEN